MKQPTLWLTNELRPYFGLQQLNADWELMELRAGYWIALEDDVIRKCMGTYEQAYSETDVHIETRDRQWILPQTAKGKEKKLNFSNITSIKAASIKFSAGIRDHDHKGYVTVTNPNNTISLPLGECPQCHTREELLAWLQQYPTLLPADYDQKLERLLYAKRTRYNAIPGDIFRVELDLYHDAYVLVVGDLRKMQKDGLFSEYSIWNQAMTMPLFVRPYLYRTTNRSTQLADIIMAPQSDHVITVMDDHFLRGHYEHVGHKLLDEQDIAFPIGYGKMNAKPENGYSLSWGTGTAFKPESEVQFTAARTYINNGVYSGISPHEFEPLENRDWPKTLDHPLYIEARQKAMAEFGFPVDISYDDFNKQTCGLTRRQYLEYLQGTYARYGKAKDQK
ncbi:immunity 26/phosphotriesterase HocA family protein [Paenibacillus hunanensis]|uniref:immunity 26/phosphotriesterase HocA family protein n=1 Tax=Paenibacillus hunanensis TaxID=539262 RepID=UPI002A69B048|nr:immunity 26/phosphotriesterase HocA family protein [Paenibacillus hunanensis]WPP39769.1 immunity 26/phosphotriesterase HocA family protein [Paenibacillus hunanensis]